VKSGLELLVLNPTLEHFKAKSRSVPWDGVASSVNCQEGDAVILDETTSKLLVEVPRAPVLLDRTAEAMHPLLRAEEWHSSIKVTRINENTPFLRTGSSQEFLEQRDCITVDAIIRVIKGSKTRPFGSRTSMDCSLNLRKVKISSHVGKNARVVVLMTTHSLLLHAPLGHEVSTITPLACIAEVLVIKAHISIDIVKIDVIRNVLESSSLSLETLSTRTSVITRAIGHVVLPVALGLDLSVSRVGDVAMSIHKSEEAPSISASVSFSNFIEVAVHCSIASHKTLHVNLTLGILEENLLAELRNVMPTIALSSHIKVVLAELRIGLEPALQEFVVILGNDIIIGLPVLFIIGIRESNIRRRLKVDDIGDLVPRMRVDGQILASDILTEGTMLNKETDQRRRTWTTIEPKNNRIVLGVVLALNEPVEEVPSLFFVHSDITSILGELNKRVINTRKVSNTMFSYFSQYCTSTGKHSDSKQTPHLFKKQQ